MRPWMGYTFLEEHDLVYLQFHDHYHSQDFIDALKTVMSNHMYHKGLTTIIDLTNKKGSYLGFNIQRVLNFAQETQNLPSTVYFISSNPILTAFGYLTKKRIAKQLNLEVVSSISSVLTDLKLKGVHLEPKTFEKLDHILELGN